MEFLRQYFMIALLTGVMTLAHGLGQRLAADDSQTPSQPDVQTEVPQKVIVLTNGRVINGDVIDRPGGYLIENSIGQMVIPYTQVRLTAIDLPEAYRKLKLSMREPTASAHVSLGQWCYENRLYDSAREQVKAALILEPERKEARTLLKNIERTTLGDTVEASVPTMATKTRDGFETSEATSLEGLSTSVTQDFVRRVQPLLMNKCGNARCHGAAGTSDFRLAPVRLGMSGYRTLTDQNLASIRRYIDPQQPRTSSVLTVPQGQHGGRGPIWNGPRADEQLAELRAWVTRIAYEQDPTATAMAAETTSASEATSGTKRDPFLQEVLAEERPDRFDPAVFNRLMHGRE